MKISNHFKREAVQMLLFPIVIVLLGLLASIPLPILFNLLCK